MPHYGLDDRATGVRSLAEAKDFSSCLSVCTSFPAHPAPYQWAPGVLSPGLKLGRGVTLTAHHRLVPKSRMSRSYISSPPCRLHGVCGTALFFTFINSIVSVIVVGRSCLSNQQCQWMLSDCMDCVLCITYLYLCPFNCNSLELALRPLRGLICGRL
jgi:hypothetical protein